MAVEAIGVSAASDANVPKNAIVDQESFLKILLTQLRFQDPLKPMDNQEFVAQLAQFSAIEINRQQSAKVDTLLEMNSASQAVSLLGRQVEVRGQAGTGVGEVIAVSFATGEANLTVRTAAATILGARLNDVQLIQEGN